MYQEVIHEFSEDLKLKFTCEFGDYFPFIEYKEDAHKIPLIINDQELTLILRDIKDI